MLLTEVLISNIFWIKLSMSCSTNSTLRLFFKKCSSSSPRISFHEEYAVCVQKIYIFILIQLSPTASSPNNQPSAKVIKLLFFFFTVRSDPSSIQKTYNILTVISHPILVGHLSSVLYISFYMLWTNISEPKKSLPERKKYVCIYRERENIKEQNQGN